MPYRVSENCSKLLDMTQNLPDKNAQKCTKSPKLAQKETAQNCSKTGPNCSKLLNIAKKLLKLAQNCGAESRRGFFFPCPGFFFLICSVFRPLHLSCHVPSMLHAICSILELEPFILHVLCSLWELEPSMLHAICSILELELSILHAIYRIWAQEPSI